MTNKELDDYIESLSQKGSVLGLDTEKELLSLMGNPEKNLKFVHIAGTNGKGSTLAFISTILKCANYKVGRYISPVICEYREKIQVNGKMITQKALLEGMEYIKSFTDQMEIKPTIFEVETALSFWYFEKMKCDIVVLETGLGGRDDATNVIQNTVVCALTSISRDHMAILGNTLEEIADVKCGIIKDRSSVVTTYTNEEVLSVINKEASKHAASVDISIEPKNIKYKLSGTTFDLGELKKISISLLGVWQPENAALAVAVINALRKKGFVISDDNIYKGLKETEWYGRFSVLKKKPLIICDGAHNEKASLLLRDTIKQYVLDKDIIFIMGVLKDKEYEKVIKNTVDLAKQIITVATPNKERTMSAYELAMAVREYNENVTEAGSVEEALEMASLLAGKDCAIIAFGSLSYLGKLKSLIK